MFSGLSFKNPEEIRDNPKSVKDSWEKPKSREPSGESGRVGNYEKINEKLTNHKLISNIVLSSKRNTEKFYTVFYKRILDAENPFRGSLNKHAALLLGYSVGN